jgi:PPOX class probable F420-dependent enzyme
VDDRVRTFLQDHHSAVMATIKPDGRPHVARISCGLVDGKLWSSGGQKRARTRFVRRDPRATLFVFDERDAQSWLGLECTVNILEGPEAVDQNLALYRTLAGEPTDLDEYRAAMVSEQRLIYEFVIERSYGQA